MSLNGCVGEFSKLLLSQLNLYTEGEHLLQFAENFDRTWSAHDRTTIGFPTPYLQVSSTDVLVESFEPGVSLSTYLIERENTQATLRRRTTSNSPRVGGSSSSSSADAQTQRMHHVDRRIAEIGTLSFFEMVLVHNFIHSDLHPGNILIAPRNPTPTPTGDLSFDVLNDDIRLIYLDVGLTTVLPQESRLNFISLFSAVASGQGQRAASLMVERSKDPTSCVDMQGFVRGMSAVIDDAIQSNTHGFSLGNVRIGQVLTSVMNLCRGHCVVVDDTMAQLVSSIALLDGIGRQLDPSRDLFETAQPILFRLFDLHVDYRRAIGAETRKILLQNMGLGGGKVENKV